VGHRANRILAWALVVSCAVHLMLLGSAGGLFALPAAELDFPIEASLAAAEAGPAPAARPAPPAARPVRPRPPPPAPAVPPESPRPVPPEPDPVPLPVPPESPAVAEPESAPPTEPAAESVAPPPERPPSRQAVRELADDLVIRYSVQTGEGEGGFVAGRATYIWHRRGGRYSLVSTVEATGLAALFISGRIVQVSEGAVDANGLRPDQYWLQRNERKQDVARFNWDRNQLTLAGRPGAALTSGVQDLLGFPFHLAITAREGEPPFTLGVTNGRKLNDYGFQVIGRTTLSLRGRQLDTLHLQGVREGEGVLDVWLDLARSGLPARIRTLDRKGKVMELHLEGVGAAASGGEAKLFAPQRRGRFFCFDEGQLPLGRHLVDQHALAVMDLHDLALILVLEPIARAAGRFGRVVGPLRPGGAILGEAQRRPGRRIRIPAVVAGGRQARLCAAGIPASRAGPRRLGMALLGQVRRDGRGYAEFHGRARLADWALTRSRCCGRR
jgi:hypothetical protein